MTNPELIQLLTQTLNTIRQQPTPSDVEIDTAWILSGLIGMIAGRAPVLPQPQPQSTHPQAAPQAQPKQPSPAHAQQGEEQPKLQPELAVKEAAAFNSSKFNWREWFEQQEAAEKASGTWYSIAKGKNS